MNSVNCECGACLEPLVKWQGGKDWLPRKHADLLPRFQDIATYREPFLGGGALAARYLHWCDYCRHCDPRPEDVAGGTVPECRGCDAGIVRVPCVLSDAEAPLMAMYRGVRDAPEKVIELLQALSERYSAETYYAIRDLFNQTTPPPETATDATRAAWLIFLNKTGFNGVYRKNRKGGYNVPFGNPEGKYKKPTIVNAANIRNWSSALRRPGVILERSDFRSQIAKAQRGDFFFLDLPYVARKENKNGKGFSDYTAEGFSMKDQEEMAEMLPDIDLAGAKFMLTNHPEAAHLYEGWDITEVQVPRHGNSDGKGRGAVTEIVVRNY
jgi:DNA adenine methylase